jgi:hypothetical protein
VGFVVTKAGAIQWFWGAFDIPAYEENAVPTGEDAPAFPYITYQFVSDVLGYPVAMTASIWYRSTSWVDANAKAEQVSKWIGRSGKIVPCDGGAVWIRRGSPFSQSMRDATDDSIKRKVINITAEYLTAD